jgi:hypothetical protein
MIFSVRRLAQVVLACWFAAAMSLFQACVAPGTGYRYQSTGQTVSPVGASASSSATGQGSLGAPPPSSTDSGSAFDATGYTPDSSESAALTGYLKSHRLPLVGAQVLQNSQGDRAVVLYGFVATPFGKSDAAAQARSFMKDGDMTVANRIEIRPELLSSNAPSSASPDNSSAASAGVRDYENQQNQTQQYQQYQQQQQQQYALQQYQQQQGSALSTLLPLLAIAGLLGMSMAGGSSGFGGFGVSPGYPSGYPAYPGPGYPPGPVPYNPYPGYGSPFSPYP